MERLVVLLLLIALVVVYEVFNTPLESQVNDVEYFKRYSAEVSVRYDGNYPDVVEITKGTFEQIKKRFFTCQGCLVGFPNCKVRIDKELDYMPTEQPRIDRNLMDKVALAFKTYLCILPPTPRNESLQMCDYKPKINNFFCDLTVGKFLKWWDHILLRNAIGMDRIDPDFMHLQFWREDEEKWVWKPTDEESCEDNTNGWLVQDICTPELSKIKRLQTTMITRQFKKFGRMANKQATASSSLFFQGLALRHILDNHLGTCFIDAIDEVLKKQTVFVPRDSNNNPKTGYCGPFQGEENDDEVGFDGNGLVLSMHIRRGDSCENWSDVRKFRLKPRYCFKTEMYFKYAQRMKEKYGVCRIRLATDSQEIMGELQAMANEYDFEISVLDYDRELFKPNKKGTDGFIENRVFSKEERKYITSTSLADIIFLSKGDMVVGNGASTMTRLVYLAIIAYTGRVAPFQSLDQELEILHRHGSCSFNYW